MDIEILLLYTDINDLIEGKSVAIITDAGTPCISDPGNELIREAIQNGIRVSPIPGCCAVIAALSVSGFDLRRFAFYGFFPRDNASRQKLLTKIVQDSSVNTFIEQVFQSGRWAISGQWKGEKSQCERFEEQYAAFNGSGWCCAFDHGSSALLATMQGLGIGPGDEVIVPALTWVACIISICNINATPVVVDVDPDTYCISPESIRKAITPHTKAIMPVHL